jgi:2-keto-4-pentenoate hydratase/2-oxohepta-3-ene-1,7-dioic acid hydratase in catechol pathway
VFERKRRGARSYRSRNFRRHRCRSNAAIRREAAARSFLKIGDVVEVSSPQIGVLSNQIVIGESE